MANALPLPKYHQIYLVLREQLHAGRFAQGLPGELALMRQFDVARVTVRRTVVPNDSAVGTPYDAARITYNVSGTYTVKVEVAGYRT